MIGVLAIALVLSAGAITALALRLGGLKSKLTREKVARELAEKALNILTADVEEGTIRHAEELAQLKQEIENLYDELETCGDDASRGRAATRGILGMLSVKKTADDPGSN
jgi:hypothetical protein